MEYQIEKISEPKDLAKLIKKTKCVILKFSATWCGPCQNKEFKKKYEELKSNYTNQVSIKFIELDLDKNEELINDTQYYNFNVSSIPHFKICYDGNVVEQYTGASNLDDINNYINTVLKKLV